MAALLGLAGVGLAEPVHAQEIDLSRGFIDRGDRGPQVRNLQAALNRAIGSNLVVDGIFGPATDAAVRVFQRRSGLAPDGVVGPRTKAALDQALGGGSSGGGIIGGIGGGGTTNPAPPTTTNPGTVAPGVTPANPPAPPVVTGGSGSLALPARAGNAASGSAVFARVRPLDVERREAEFTTEIFMGNVPSFLRQLRPVTITGSDSQGAAVELTIFVTPDYLAVGSDSDFVRVPLSRGPAGQIAERLDCVVPTVHLVDAIYRAAEVTLRPQTIPPSSAMTTTPVFLRHNGMVEQQRASVGGALGRLTAGHKKDVVNTNRVHTTHTGRVAIYGWHRSASSPIQPLSTHHGQRYADYSHGVRLISRRARLNGQSVDLATLLTDRRYAGLIGDRDGSSQALVRAALP